MTGIGPMIGNTLWMGGEQGGDMAIMLHKYDLGGLSKYVGSGIYLGALRQGKEK